MPAHWLLKSEPGDYSYDDLARDKKTVWDGVRNPLALKHMRQVRPGDEALFYHTGKERAVVGIARVESEPYPDPAADDDRLVVFEVSAGGRLARPVRLVEIKQSGKFAEWELVRMPRLSVMPVPRPIWSRILRMAERR